MRPQLILICHILHPAVTHGFLPVGQKLGYNITLVTDHGLAHKDFYANSDLTSPIHIVECDVFNPIAIIDLIYSLAIKPSVVFSNSDHLQTATALVANYFSVPSKPWICCYHTKNKAAMRQRLVELDLPTTAFLMHTSGESLPTNLCYPIVAKPREGVASMDVRLCNDANELEAYCTQFFRKEPGVTLLLENYMEGALFTLETLSDGQTMHVVGGFDVTLGEPPHFVETQAQWNGTNTRCYQEQALAQLIKFGVGFGVCHSEFIVTAQGPVLVEINYRSIGDGREFLLDKLVKNGWFETILCLHAGESLKAIDCQSSHALIHYVVANQEGTLLQQDTDFENRKGNVWWQYQPLKEQGDRIKITHSNKDYIGVLSAIGDDENDVNTMVTSITEQLQWEIT